MTTETAETLAVPVAELRPALEALLIIADQPMDTMTLATAAGYPVAEVSAALEGLAAEYTEQGRGFELRHVGGGWRYYTRDEYAAVVEGFVLDGQQARLTQAALETLAVVAYKQPVSRARVSAIRGVNVDGVMRTLLTRGLVEEAGQDHETGANLYRTTTYFLERIGVTSLLRPSSYWNFRRPFVSRSCQRTNRRRRAVLAPAVAVSTCSQMNHVGKMGAATPRGIPSRASTDVGGVRNERVAAGSRRPCSLSSCSRRIVRRGSGSVVNALPFMSHCSRPPTTTDRVGRSIIAPGPKVEINWLTR